MANTLYDRTIAFASICQSVKLVQNIARTGHYDEEALHTSLKSILVMNPASTVATFGHENQLKLGLETFLKEFDHSPNNSELTKYIINLLTLERKLSSRRDSLSQLGDRITTLDRQTQHFELLDDQMISNIASVYLDVISPLGPRIQVSGNPEQLKQTHVQNKVRALLLAGIRGTVLWRQVGGKRRHLLFSRKRLLEQAKIILARNS